MQWCTTCGRDWGVERIIHGYYTVDRKVLCHVCAYLAQDNADRDIENHRKRSKP